MIRFIFTLCILLIFSACVHKNSPVAVLKDLSSFKLNQAALLNHAKVNLFAFSGMPEDAKPHTFYYQYIVTDSVSDTFKILVPSELYFSDNHRRFKYISANSKDKADLIMLHLTFTGQSPKDIPDSVYTNLVLPDIKKVAVNASPDFPDQRDYPAVIGTLVSDSDPFHQ